MNLYEMSKNFETALDDFDALINPDWVRNEDGDYITDDGEIVTPDEYREMIDKQFSVLDGMEQDVEVKAENVAVYIKAILADAEQIKAEERRLAARRKAEGPHEGTERGRRTCVFAPFLLPAARRLWYNKATQHRRGRI